MIFKHVPYFFRAKTINQNIAPPESKGIVTRKHLVGFHCCFSFFALRGSMIGACDSFAWDGEVEWFLESLPSFFFLFFFSSKMGLLDSGLHRRETNSYSSFNM